MENKKITIIKLLNDISKYEIVPKQIKYRGVIYTFDAEDRTYYDENDKTFFLMYNFKILNDTVEILPEENDEWKDIEEIEQIISSKAVYDNWEDITKDIQLIVTTIDDLVISFNQLIKNQRKIIEKLEEK